ncbi:hypothetical protein PR202_gb06849 [Eleusine coracana subsp. coracana]|uniref:F-box domain-containing protein n=1 Tax=Eleusine coracana subsp. coracana TaxID=191504 RepID=A0AAV5EAQ2_ELECO|nr:hypothetical protein PR202_gb06849 [Eleusine coracana subsp. coracana]
MFKSEQPELGEAKRLHGAVREVALDDGDYTEVVPGSQQPLSRRRSATNKQDLLSLLPDCVLGEIVTRLPTRDAVHLQLVSSRYRNAWRASPLNLDVDYRDAARVLVYRRCHPGPTRRLRLERLTTSYYGDFDHWLLFSPALAGLQVLELQLQTLDNVSRRPLPPPALRFAATLVVLKIGSFTFPSPPAAAKTKPLRFPRLELLSFRCVDISEAALHGLLAGFPALETLVLDECVGFARVRITSATIRSVAVSSAGLQSDQATAILPRQVTIEDAPRLETVVPFRHPSCSDQCRRSLDLRIVSAPKLRVLGGACRPRPCASWSLAPRYSK